MLDFLNKLTHQHEKKKIQPKADKHQQQSNYANQFGNGQQKTQSEQKRNQQKKYNKKLNKSEHTKPKILSLSAQLQNGQKADLDPDVLRILQHVKQQSEKLFNEVILCIVSEERSKVQRKVYLRQMSNSYDQYLQEILIQSSSPNRFLRHGIAQIVDNIAGAIQEEIIFTDKYQVQKKNPMTKDELALLQKSISQIRNNEGNIRDKVGQLKLQLKNQSEKINDRTIQIMEKQSYSMNHPKTKEVQLFLKNLQLQREDRKYKYHEQRKQREERKNQIYQMMEMQREKAKSQRHQRLVEAYQIKRKVKEDQILQAAKKNEQFKEWMKLYKNKQPMFERKQKQYKEKFMKQQVEQRMQKLIARRDNYYPITSQQLQEHQQRYMEYKKDIKLRQSAQRKMQKQMQKKREKQLSKLHKGEFRYFILEQMVAKQEKKDPKQQIIDRKIRQLAYSEHVKQDYKPKIDQVKKMQMQTILNSSTSRKNRKPKGPVRVGSVSLLQTNNYTNAYGEESQQQRDPRKQGQRMRRYLKQYIRQKIDKGQIINKQQKQQSQTIQSQIDYLQQLRNNRLKSSRKAQTIDHQINLIKEKQDIGALIAKVKQTDEYAQRMQKKLKYARHKPQQQASLQNNYLFSIKAKMQLLKNFD